MPAIPRIPSASRQTSQENRTPMTPRRTSAVLVAVALASGAGGAGVAVLAGDASPTETRIVTTTTADTARPASAAVESDGGLSVNEIVGRTKSGVVDIKVRSSGGTTPDRFGNPDGGEQQSQAEGSGFVLDDDGHIATNQHVVDGATSITVTFANGHTASAKVVGSDASTD